MKKYFYTQRWEWLADVLGSLLAVWVRKQCVLQPPVLSCNHTLLYVTSGLKSNQTGTIANWSSETWRPELYLSMLYLTRSARLLDSETSGCSKDANKHAPPKVQLQCCLHKRCGLGFLAVCLVFWLLSRSFEKEKRALFEWQGTTVVLLPHPHLDCGYGGNKVNKNKHVWYRMKLCALGALRCAHVYCWKNFDKNVGVLREILCHCDCIFKTKTN